MFRAIPANLFPLAVLALCSAAFAFWIRIGPGTDLQARIPGADRSANETEEKQLEGPKYGIFKAGAGRPAANVGSSWPRFRGPEYDGVSTERTPLARRWPASGPAVLWSLDVGEGHAGAAVHRGCVYMLDYDREEQSDVLRCLSLEDGAEIWRFSYPVKVKRNHGMSRTIPTVTDRFVVSLGPKCHVICLDSASGTYLWGLDLVEDFGVTVPPWYAGQCPLVEDGKAILALGGDNLMMAFDCESARAVWHTPNPRGWKMSHSSIVPMTVNGRRMYVYCASGGVAGVAADDGSLLWYTENWKIRIATVPSPVPVGDGRIFLTGGYNAGSAMLQVTEKEGRFVPEIEYRLAPDVFSCEQHTPVLFEEHLYGVRPDGELACLRLDGTLAWSSNTGRFFGKGLGPWLAADDIIFAMNEQGVLVMAEASPLGYRELGRAKVLEGHDSWGPMALAGGRLIVRDVTHMVCLDVGKR